MLTLTPTQIDAIRRAQHALSRLELADITGASLGSIDAILDGPPGNEETQAERAADDAQADAQQDISPTVCDHDIF